MVTIIDCNVYMQYVVLHQVRVANMASPWHQPGSEGSTTEVHYEICTQLKGGTVHKWPKSPRTPLISSTDALILWQTASVH